MNEKNKNTVFQAIKDGPLKVSGNFRIFDNQGNPVVSENEVFLCRCGKTSTTPFCDESHCSIQKD